MRGRVCPFRALLVRRFRGEERGSGGGFAVGFRLSESLSEGGDCGGVVLLEGGEEDTFRAVVGELVGGGGDEGVEDVDVGCGGEGATEIEVSLGESREDGAKRTHRDGIFSEKCCTYFASRFSGSCLHTLPASSSRFSPACITTTAVATSSILYAAASFATASARNRCCRSADICGGPLPFPPEFPPPPPPPPYGFSRSDPIPYGLRLSFSSSTADIPLAARRVKSAASSTSLRISSVF